jgi:hypothetical protein
MPESGSKSMLAHRCSLVTQGCNREPIAEFARLANSLIFLALIALGFPAAIWSGVDRSSLIHSPYLVPLFHVDSGTRGSFCSLALSAAFSRSRLPLITFWFSPFSIN